MNEDSRQTDSIDKNSNAMAGVGADRVLLGLIPSSEESWPLAVAVLKEVGGVMHVHGNVAEDKVLPWASHVAATIQQIAWVSHVVTHK